MKIICILGSPRKHGNTARILQELEKRGDDLGKVEIIYLTDYKINGCLGCSICQTKLDTTGCVQKDAVSMLLDKLINADVIIYGTPLYGHSYSGQLKIFLDRHVALFKFLAGADKSVDEMKIFSFIENKPVGLIVSCQGPEEDNTELIKAQFDKFCESSLTKCFGKYVFPYCDNNNENTELSQTTLSNIVKDIKNLSFK